MSRPLSKNQAAVLALVEQIFAQTGRPVPFVELRASGVQSRFMTSTVASLIDRDAIFVPEQGVASYLPVSERVAQLARLLKVSPELNKVDRDLSIKRRLFGMGVKDECSRCGGSGRYSFNTIDGDRCFGCSGRRYVSVPLTTAKTWERARAAVEAGHLDRYLAAVAARAEALAKIKPLRAEIETLSTAIREQADRAFGKYSVRTSSQETTAASVRSHSHRIRARSNDLSGRASEVESAIELKTLDPEVGPLWAVAILTEARDDLRALLASTRAMTDDELRAQVHPDFACPHCRETLSVFGDMKSGQRVICFYPWVRNARPGAGCRRYTNVP